MMRHGSVWSSVGVRLRPLRREVGGGLLLVYGMDVDGGLLLSVGVHGGTGSSTASAATTAMSILGAVSLRGSGLDHGSVGGGDANTKSPYLHYKIYDCQ